MKAILFLAFLLVAGAFANDTYKYAGVLLGATKSLAPSFDSTGACTTGSESTEAVSFAINVTTPGAYFVQGMFEKSIVSGSTVRVLNAANIAATPCVGLVRGGASASGKAPHVHYTVTFATAGTYYVYVQAGSALTTNSGIFAIHLYPAHAWVDTSASAATWTIPDSYDQDGTCQTGSTTATYGTFSWGRPAVSGWYDAYIVYQSGNASSSDASLAMYASDTNAVPVNFGNSTFDVCANSSTTLLKGIANTDDGYNFGLTYGKSAILFRFWASNNTYYYFAFGSSDESYVGTIALRVEPTRFAQLDERATQDFMQPSLSTTSCSDGSATHFGSYTFTPEEGQYVFVVDTGYSEFDAVGSLYRGNNSGSPTPVTCPTGAWVMTVDLGDISPLATYPFLPGQLYTAVVGVYNGGSNSNAGQLFQLWALGGNYLGPAVPGTSSPAGAPGSGAPGSGAPSSGTPGSGAPGSGTPGTPTGSTASQVAISALVVLAAVLALLF